MKIQSMILAASLALVPATAAFADDAKKEELKKAKAEALQKKIEEAKAKAAAKAEAKVEKAVAKTVEKKEAIAEAAKAVDDAAAKAAEEEKTMHAKHMGAIERLDQIAKAVKNAELEGVVARLMTKETERHTLAAAAPAAAAPAAK